MNRVTDPTHDNNSANKLLLADKRQLFMNRKGKRAHFYHNSSRARTQPDPARSQNRMISHIGSPF
ncbi:hypothetical protein TSUD_317280 [Trifolium subterraneum]|uniref:Uncharacterized protein n=1 Tax=Trifolium subterraneum TaxID=3900 RepID=A0A2Z6MSM7_TRISU|nr:hypothetical protein TSUD_317280 [Trifolium subterraneum]